MRYLLVCIPLLTSLYGLSPAAWADESLMKSKACIACHSVERKIVGPAFKDVAAKRQGEDGALQILVDHIRNGSKGVYGPVPMPPNTRVNEEEAKKLAEWILQLK
ncbi:c-type cytochrome [Lampropedia puyangensis]|uniref:C-type cytochrome n=1 Tax=Lampropedia puyangensis TaxID=1330072 RepID=A0A4S8ESY2_9BURK|nr:c-type cytochrome [Lampropedia puyangensis]THT97947.1 c-type cytochrome [Lampropedia puyangensis]